MNGVNGLRLDHVAGHAVEGCNIDLECVMVARHSYHAVAVMVLHSHQSHAKLNLAQVRTLHCIHKREHKYQYSLHDVSHFLCTASRITDRTKSSKTGRTIAKAAGLCALFKHQKSNLCKYGLFLMPGSNSKLTKTNTHLSESLFYHS